MKLTNDENPSYNFEWHRFDDKYDIIAPGIKVWPPIKLNTSLPG